MEDEKKAEPAGKNEKLLICVCGRVGAKLSFNEKISSDGKDMISAVLSGPGASSGLKYEIGSLPKASREDACKSVVRQLLFPEVAVAIGVPPASSVDELTLKIEVMGPS